MLRLVGSIEPKLPKKRERKLRPVTQRTTAELLNALRGIRAALRHMRDDVQPGAAAEVDRLVARRRTVLREIERRTKEGTMPRHHIAISVDVDRHSDAYLEKAYAGCVTEDGEPVTIARLRELCNECRAQGYKVIPPCDHYGPDGHCLGHTTAEDSETREKLDDVLL